MGKKLPMSYTSLREAAAFPTGGYANDYTQSGQAQYKCPKRRGDYSFTDAWGWSLPSLSIKLTGV
ncbi:hypothetical protein IQ246_24825 [aff. Roholtiella sp. LEGE 12411]|nr:hypothetical protein [aff. Roholtiella sp. LEGE 12411]